MRLVPLSLLRHSSFRSLATSTVLNAVGMMGETVVLGWLTLELTNSPFYVGVAMGARAIPFFFAGIPAGALADHVHRHRLLVITGVGQALATASLGALTLLGLVSLGPLLLLTCAAGTIRAVEQAARQGYTHDVTGARELVNGLAVLGIATRAGWLVGSLASGAVIARAGSGPAYLVVAAAYLAGTLALLAGSGSAPVRAAGAAGAPSSLWRSVVDFGGAVRRDRTLVMLMLLTAGAEVLGFSHQTVLPTLARDVLRVGPEGLGAMNAARAIGGMLGLIAVSARGSRSGGGALFLTVLVLFGVGVVGLGLAPSFVGFAGVLAVVVVVNAAGSLTDLLAQSLMQLAVPASLRGRAGGAWVVAIGLAPLGQLQIGAMASAVGVAVALGASGLALVALAGATALLVPALRRL